MKCQPLDCLSHALPIGLLGLYTVSKVSDSIGMIKSIPVSVSETQINDTFNDTFHDDINKQKAILNQTWINFLIILIFVFV